MRLVQNVINWKKNYITIKMQDINSYHVYGHNYFMRAFLG